MDKEEYVRGLIRQAVNQLFEYDAFKFKSEKETYIPTGDIAITAFNAKSVYDSLKDKSAVKSIDSGGNQGSGTEIVNKLINKEPLSYDSAIKMLNFFNKNKELVAKERKNNGIRQFQHNSPLEMNKSAIILMWNLHGGDKCYEWLRTKLDNNHDSKVDSKRNRQETGGAGEGNGPGIFDLSVTDSTKQRIHRNPKPPKIKSFLK